MSEMNIALRFEGEKLLEKMGAPGMNEAAGFLEKNLS